MCFSLCLCIMGEFKMSVLKRIVLVLLIIVAFAVNWYISKDMPVTEYTFHGHPIEVEK